MGDSAMRQQQLRRRRLLESASYTDSEDEDEGDGEGQYEFEYDRDVGRCDGDDGEDGDGDEAHRRRLREMSGGGPSTTDAERRRLLRTSPPCQDGDVPGGGGLDGGGGPSGEGDGDGHGGLDDRKNNSTATPSGGWNGGEEGENSGSSKVEHGGSYFARMDDMRRDAWDRLYENTVDGPCQQTCQALVACEQNLEENFKEINCKQLMFFNFPRDPNGGGGMGGGSMRHHVHVPGVSHFPGAAGPRPCEYCHQMECEDDCERPELFFLNKKPPFATNDDEWDEDDYPIDKMGENGAGDNRSVRNEAGWMSGFF